ncbi:TPM domain-containing protein [Mucilaginibacter achroorhodeus]|uniref:TPM domain-containing protein n=1 Tax=Mucilaginibacter achroorhodeus TaxID=2599294 RepID=A0A563UAV4_9SPHI|nr:TPM domain-containing protein [Mucilaginibacter achroorhodeus]TWR28456.1 TPM domain-containing protein [Mucilaginibacter achroorhodeus]
MLKKLFLSVGLLLLVAITFAQDIPQRSNTLITDYTNTLSESDKQTLERKLVAYNDSTSTQIAVVMMQSTGEYDINQYATDLLRKWGIGSKEKNNGVLVLVALKDRKMAIATGYGAEGSLPDITTQEIIQNDMKPRFRENDYYGGLNAATDDIIKAMRGEYKSDKKPGGKDGGGSALAIIIIVVVVLIIIFRSRGGGGGGGRRIIGGRGGADPFWWFLAGNMLGNSGRSSGSDWGGFSGGGGGWGGGDSGGGSFGGFGGGSGGGGGSSGSW